MKFIVNYAIKRNNNAVKITFPLAKSITNFATDEQDGFYNETSHLVSELASSKLINEKEKSDLHALTQSKFSQINVFHFKSSAIFSSLILHSNSLEIVMKKTATVKDVAAVTALLRNLSILDIDENPKAANFYCNSGGTQILKDKNYPDSLSHYLESENEYVNNYIKANPGKYTAFFEVGCGKLRNLKLAQTNGLKYYGIDFVPKYIEKAKKFIAEQGLEDSVFAECLSIFDFGGEKNFIPQEERVLCLFPFNALGNIGNVLDILARLNGLKYDVLISSYKTDTHTTQVRKEYFEKCHYTNLQITESESGVTFTSDEGLKSIGFNPAYLVDLCKTASYGVVQAEFGEIGMMYSLKANAPKPQKLFTIVSAANNIPSMQQKDNEGFQPLSKSL